MYLFDYARQSEVLLHSHSKVKHPLMDRWPILFENLVTPPQFLPVEEIVLVLFKLTFYFFVKHIKNFG